MPGPGVGLTQVEIHDGPYNRISGWDYVGLVRAMHNEKDNALNVGGLFATRVRTRPGELLSAGFQWEERGLLSAARPASAARSAGLRATGQYLETCASPGAP